MITLKMSLILPVPINNKKITMNMNPEPEPEVVEDTNPTISYQKLRACKFCNIVYPMTEL